MQSNELHSYIITKLQDLYDVREAESIGRILLEHLTADIPEDALRASVDQCLGRVRAGEPVQYVIGKCWFYDLHLKVSPDVLIPRPETEELVSWVLEDHRNKDLVEAASMLDVGTGSGCIALALKKEIPTALIKAVDLSERAIMLAAENAEANGLVVTFMRHDILSRDLHEQFDVIVSNPPYITTSEFEQLDPSVRDFEPRTALIAKGDDGLIFYRRLATIGQKSLRKAGRIYVELNEFHVDEIKQIFETAGYASEIRKDLQGKRRMLKAFRTANGS
jgi:release factor glutamine methyltransferase